MKASLIKNENGKLKPEGIYFRLFAELYEERHIGLINLL
jgi:hypothetical protein